MLMFEKTDKIKDFIFSHININLETISKLAVGLYLFNFSNRT